MSSVMEDSIPAVSAEIKKAAKLVYTIGVQPLSIEQVVDIAEGHAKVALDSSTSYRKRIDTGADILEQLLQRDGLIYGVTTGYGDSCSVNVSKELAYELPKQIYTFHGCGLGEFLSETEGRAVLVTRLVSLARGFSGVSWGLLEKIVAFINAGIVPQIPSEGSVGASGDLTPLSYVAATLCGERDVYYKGKVIPVMDALNDQGITPLKLRPKEGLALMNGTAVMTALACLNYQRADYVMQLSTRITAMNLIVLDGNDYHFDARLFAVKPHPGQSQIAQWLREDLKTAAAPEHSSRLQDRYSLRCAPHVIGVLADSLPHYRQFIETELNSTNDNPIIDPETRAVLHGGHFYGGHIAQAMDGLKTAVANIADLLDRQLAQAVDIKFNHGLPRNLSGASGERAVINHGLKAVQIGVSAWTAEALKNTMPASVFSRSTECHNQDKVSMGTIAARDCRRVLEQTEQVVAAVLFAAAQGLFLRERAGKEITSTLKETMQEVFSIMPPLFEDRALDSELRALIKNIRMKFFTTYERV